MFDNFLELTKWTLSHLVTWAALNCLVVGAWWIHQNLALYIAKEDPAAMIATMTTEQKNAVAEALFASGGEEVEGKKRKG